MDQCANGDRTVLRAGNGGGEKGHGGGAIVLGAPPLAADAEALVFGGGVWGRV